MGNQPRTSKEEVAYPNFQNGGICQGKTNQGYTLPIQTLETKRSYQGAFEWQKKKKRPTKYTCTNYPNSVESDVSKQKR